MKNAREIVDYIDDYVFHCLQRPAMYASSPQALEDILRVCDQIRNFAMEVKEDLLETGCASYRQFLSSKGFGAQAFTDVKDNQGLNDVEIFNSLVRIYREYLVKKGIN
jgi:hypothetical protein